MSLNIEVGQLSRNTPLYFPHTDTSVSNLRNIDNINVVKSLESDEFVAVMTFVLNRTYLIVGS